MTAHTRPRTDVGWDALDDHATLHRAALARTARQLTATTNSQAHTWAAALRWLTTATDNPPPPDTHWTDHATQLAHIDAWRAHWETTITRPQITTRRDRYIRMDQDLRAATWALEVVAERLTETTTIGAP